MTEELLIEPPAERGMDAEETALATRFYKALQSYTVNTARGIQASEFRVGVSDLGYCSERTVRMLRQDVPEDTDMLLAFLGSAIGDHVEAAIADNDPTAVLQATVTVPLVGEQRTYEVTGHPDVILPTEGMVVDGKTAYGLALARRLGADQQKQFQRHLYAKGAWLGGYFGNLPLEQVRVANVWLDRSGRERCLHVEIESYDENIINEAARWLDETVYAFINGTEARKEPAYEICRATCGFFNTCRALEGDTIGLLTDPVVLEAVDMYDEGRELEKQGRAMKKEANTALKDITGSTGKFRVKWVHINEAEIPATTRRGYDRIDISHI